jgi:cytochrome P450
MLETSSRLTRCVVSFQRIVKQPITLSDGLYLPIGTHICMPAHPMSMDRTIIPNAEQFDGFRWFKEGLNASSFVNTNPTHMHFGLGKYACPGRFFAVIIMKIILSRLLQKYDFKFEDGQKGRPASLSLDVGMIPDPAVKVMFRKREGIA